MRRILIDWIVQVQEEYNMNTQCIHLAVNYIDSFLGKMSVVSHNQVGVFLRLLQFIQSISYYERKFCVDKVRHRNSMF